MDGALLEMVVLPTIGVVLVIAGLVLFVVDLSVTNHGVPTAGGILELLAGGLVLLWAGVPYSGALLAALGVVALLMGGHALGGLGLLTRPQRQTGHYGQGGDDRRGGHRQKPGRG